MKFKVFVHPARPKIQKEKILNILRSLNLQISETSPDMALVIGGDGTFTYYGRKLSIPMLFIGVPSNEILGSKSRLAKISLQNLPKSLRSIEKGNYAITKRKMLEVKYDKSPAVNVLTDIYLERGLFAGCIRYSISVVKKNKNMENGEPKRTVFTDYAIGNGVIISTSFGSGGYYSYIDRILNPNKKSYELFDDTKVGICHILPTFIARYKGNNVDHRQLLSSIRYVVPIDSIIDIVSVRDANTRLYGATIHSKGIEVKWNKSINITASAKTASIVHLT
ncbi:hypothetical protein BH23THE1_BH23THE1_16980 [soil metagenome]